MNVLQFAEAHPWWTLIYLVVIGFFVSSIGPFVVTAKQSKEE